MSEREPERLEGRGEKQEGEGMKRACGKTGGREKKELWEGDTDGGSWAGRRRSLRNTYL